MPLGFKAETVFRIISDGYDNVNIEAEIPQDLGKVALTLDFPDQKNLGLTMKKIKVIA